jgi:hypothetical protein
MNKLLLGLASTLCVYTYADTNQTSDPSCPETACLFYTSKCPFEIDVSLGLDDFRGIPDGSWNGSFGALTALNFNVPVGRSFSAQLGGSYGLYDWAGRSSTPFKNSKTLQQQGFLTLGAAWQTPCRSGWNAGIAYDWMFNKNLGIFAVDPYIDQVRGQVGYLIRGGNEIGAWATYGIQKDHETSQNLHLTFRGISQANLFWAHYFKTEGYAMLWAGTTYRRGLHYSSGRPGRYIIGAQFVVPVTHSLSLEGHASYMGARNGAGLTPAKNDGADVYIGLTYAYGKRRIAKNPYMTLANNSNFMVDTNQNF